MKYAILGGIALISFCISLGAALALTGNLSGDKLGQLVGLSEPESVAAAEAVQDPVGPLAQELKRKEQELQERSRSLEEREKQLDQRERELEQLRQNLETLQAEINTALDEDEQERETRLMTVAATVAAMDPENAAHSLGSMPEVDVAEILRLVDEKDRGKILDAMEETGQGTTAAVLRALQEGRL